MSNSVDQQGRREGEAPLGVHPNGVIRSEAAALPTSQCKDRLGDWLWEEQDRWEKEETLFRPVVTGLQSKSLCFGVT